MISNEEGSGKQMKAFIRGWFRAIPFTVGMALSLIALSFLVRSYDYGLDFDEEEIWIFVIFFFAGFPTLVHGINVLSEKGSEHESARS